MLTARQMELLEFIVDYMDTSGGLSPSFEDMMVGVGLRSKSGVHRLIESLETRGYIRRIRHLARCIEVLRLPGEPKMTTAEEIIASIQGLLDVYENQEKRPPFPRAVSGGS